MRSLEELLKESAASHGHRCAGQVLGVRLAMAGCREVGIDEPKGCKKLVVLVEIDRCATDAIQAVTGCSLGKRTLKFLDYGKMAATFVNTETRKAVRILAKDDARSQAPLYAPDTANPHEAQKQAYGVMPEELLFSIQPARIDIAEENMPGFRGARVICASCGEGINLRREVRVGERTLCIPCAQGSWRFGAASGDRPKVILIVGYKKVGKTTLIEKLVPELSSRGYRVGTVKHHHSDFPVEVDVQGTDSARHRRAGASGVALVTPTDVALFRDTPGGASLEEVVATLHGTDIVLAEGFHKAPGLKIEVLSTPNAQRRCPGDPQLLATVGPATGDASIASFEPDAIKPLADLIEREVLGKPGASGVTKNSNFEIPSVSQIPVG
jgi:formylmethanofuran dehydrogenase subunit E